MENQHHWQNQLAKRCTAPVPSVKSLTPTERINFHVFAFDCKKWYFDKLPLPFWNKHHTINTCREWNYGQFGARVRVWYSNILVLCPPAAMSAYSAIHMACYVLYPHSNKAVYECHLLPRSHHLVLVVGMAWEWNWFILGEGMHTW